MWNFFCQKKDQKGLFFYLFLILYAFCVYQELLYQTSRHGRLKQISFDYKSKVLVPYLSGKYTAQQLAPSHQSVFTSKVI